MILNHREMAHHVTQVYPDSLSNGKIDLAIKRRTSSCYPGEMGVKRTINTRDSPPTWCGFMSTCSSLFHRLPRTANSTNVDIMVFSAIAWKPISDLHRCVPFADISALNSLFGCRALYGGTVLWGIYEQGNYMNVRFTRYCQVKRASRLTALLTNLPAVGNK